MREVYYVQFKKVGKKYYFDRNNLSFSPLDYCVVETARGIELGQIASEVIKIEDPNIIKTLKPILRHATEADFEQYIENKKMAKDAFDLCRDLIDKNELEMKLLAADYVLDRKKIVFYYTAEERIDFRNLLKDLAKHFNNRIELRQIGYRDGAKIVGGIGMCGRELCCKRFLTDFDTISIKMAKNQELSLAPSKITGVCSKLLCCIKFEDELYKELKKGLVKVGTYIKTDTSDHAKIIGYEVLKNRVITLEDGVRVSHAICECEKIES